MTHKPVSFLALLSLSVFCCTTSLAQDSKPARIFTSDVVFDVTIDAPWRTIQRHKEDDTEWQGRFIYTDTDGQNVTIPITLTTRGLTRLRVCDFPPLRIGFDKEGAKGTAFRGAGNLKLVTHCLANSRYEQYYLKEYLTYKMYNLVTPLSFRAQGLDVKYVDGDPSDKGTNRFAFLIEDPDDVAKRNGMEKLNIPEAEIAWLNPQQTVNFTLFMYMISNLDWSVLSGPKSHCCHNARLIGDPDNLADLYAIPYDLDASGLVDAHYAAPPEGLKVRSVRQRLYRGFCDHNELVAPTMDEFREQQDAFIALFENEERLDSRNRNNSIKYINAFYKGVETDKDLQNRLIDNCRG